MLKIDTTRSSTADGPKTIEAGPLRIAPGEALQLRAFVDKSMVHVFANGCQVVMRRVYPSHSDSTGVVLFAEGGSVVVPAPRAWNTMPSKPY